MKYNRFTCNWDRMECEACGESGEFVMKILVPEDTPGDMINEIIEIHAKIHPCPTCKAEKSLRFFSKPRIEIEYGLKFE